MRQVALPETTKGLRGPREHAMQIEALTTSGFVIVSHAIAALSALVLGAVQLAAPKGALSHRSLGYLWAALMLYIAIGSFWIPRGEFLGQLSPIHLLSLLVIVTLPLAVRHARRNQIQAHRRSMVRLYVFALIIAGLFTLWPGRIMHGVVFGA
jgi:uncharacterized membrane protein